MRIVNQGDCEERNASRPDGAGRPCSRRQWLQAGAATLASGAAATWLGGCSQVPPAPLKLGMNTWVGYDPLVLAREQGFLDVTDVKVIELSSNSETLRNYRNRLLDAAALTLDETLRLADEGFEPRVVAVLSASAGADLVVARSDVRDLEDLRGRRVAVEATTVGALVFQRLLQAAGLQSTDVTVLKVDAIQHAALLRNHRVDAAVTYEPLAGRLLTEGYRSIFDSRQMIGDIVDVLVVDAQALADRPMHVRALLAGWQRGLQAFRQEPEVSARLLAPGVDLTPQEYLAIGQGLQFYSPEESLALLSGAPPALGQQSERLFMTLKAMGLILDTPDWGRLLAPGPALEMARKGVA